MPKRAESHGQEGSSVRLRRAARDDLPAVVSLLRSAGLPIDGVEDHFGTFLVAEAADSSRGHGVVIVGAAGLEPYGPQGILRSVVVEPDARAGGVGRRLTDAVLGLARERALKEIFLLTMDADGYFEQWGFERLARSSVEGKVLDSAEFQGACPETAVVMRLEL